MQKRRKESEREANTDGFLTNGRPFGEIQGFHPFFGGTGILFILLVVIYSFSEKVIK